MELKLLGTCKSYGVPVFSVNRKDGKGKFYKNLDDLCADFIEGLKNINCKPQKVLIYEGSYEIRKYVAQKLRKAGYVVLNRTNPPKNHPGMGMYVILLDYFLNKTANPTIS